MNPIAIRLQECVREKNNISARRLEEITGIPKSAIQRYISGTTDRIPIDRLKLLASALGVTPAYLMGLETKSGEPVKQASEDDVDTLMQIVNQLNPDSRQLLSDFAVMLLRKQ